MLSHEISPARRNTYLQDVMSWTATPAEPEPVPGHGAASQKQYAVVLLNENQMAQLLQRLRRVGVRPAVRLGD